uniref:Transcription elongation factor putative n=1 Tax=Albugo laibachii Nc14 TaxID=890382 RepID=F0W9A3_9STRA|nr:transcription elongation factor putative [Albugo laibachii Nc14]CCA18362.1 transcription elongation factor putative [Albugo laibachii Nc14]|eukprot:CCA18362.1 transcription elongation factor putative [Albugo laibachii Nc14]
MEEVAHLHRKLLRFQRGDSTDIGEALDLLRALESKPITVNILKETKLGQTVAKLRKHDSEKIQNQSRNLIHSWKSILTLSPRTNSSSSLSPTAAGTLAKSASSISKPKSPSVETPKRKETKSSSSASFLPPGLDKMRATVRTKMKENLELADADTSNAPDVATAIEIAMARMFSVGFPGENKKDYTAKFRQLSFNLKKNARLREDLLLDVVSAEQLINMSPEELATDEKRHEIEKLRDDAFQRARLDWADANEDKINKQCGIEKNSKGLFTCGRCKSSKTSNTQKQTRSADEPMTVFVQCHNCGNRWKC